MVKNTLYLYTAALISPTTCFKETLLRPKLTTPKVYALRKESLCREVMEKEPGMVASMSTPKPYSKKLVKCPTDT
jgi:hypothetical protein